MEINKKEVYRYLGYRMNTEMIQDAETDRIIDEVCRAILTTCHPKSINRRFGFEYIAEDTIRFNTSIKADEPDYVTIKSKSLSKHLKGCSELIAFAATLGPEADLLVRRFSITSMTHASIAQAAGAAAIEGFADEECRKLAIDYPFIKPRFSPGYGDFPLSHQIDFESILCMRKNLGITLDDSLLMTPSKSITAIIGISNQADKCVYIKCQSCTKLDCEFRGAV